MSFSRIITNFKKDWRSKYTTLKNYIFFEIHAYKEIHARFSKFEGTQKLEIMYPKITKCLPVQLQVFAKLQAF